MPRRKILLLENLASPAAGLREYLTQYGYQVAVSRYEPEALKRLAEWVPDQVLVSTGHPAGDFGEYCSRVRALAPGARIIVTSSLNRARLFQQYPGLENLVDEVLLRPYSNEEVAAVLAAGPAAAPAPPVVPAADSGDAALRADFQRHLDERFLEIQELKRRLEDANKRAETAPERERLQRENERLRQLVEESRKRTALALATEQLKRSEVEVELDNALRQKEQVESLVQKEIDERKREVELVRGQLLEERGSSGKAAAEHEALRVELERVLVEKEQLEERLHTMETGVVKEAPAPEVPPEVLLRSAALEAEVSRLREQSAEGEVALADMATKAAVLEESLARAQADQLERERNLAQIPALREHVAEAARRAAELQAGHDGLQERLTAAESGTRDLQTALVEASERRAALEKELAEVQELRAGDARQARERRRELAARTRELLERAVGAERRAQELQSALTEREERLRENETARITVAAEAAALSEERQQAFDREVLAWGEKTAAAHRELDVATRRQEQGAAEQERERRGSAEQLEKAVRDLAESERRIEALRGEQAAAREAHDRETQLLAERAAAAEAVSREAGRRLEAADAALVAAREDFENRQRQAAQAVSEAGAGPVQQELQRIQQLLEEVISRARGEAVEYARRDAELTVRLQAALEERRLLQERFDRAGAEATERERRSASLLQSAIDHGPLGSVERANLPAVVPVSPRPGTGRRRLVFVVLAVVSLTALVAVSGLRRAGPPTVLEQPRPVPTQPGASPGAVVTPREVWDRFTRSDSSGGVLVQATLRGEEELLAEVEAGRASGGSDEAARAEFVRRLSDFRFDTTYYVSVYLKNLAPGYPPYLDDLPGRFRLRDSGGKEVQAFLPPGHDKDHRIFSFGAGAPGDLIYEASVSLGFDRAGLSPSTDYLQLVISDVGSASRRVLTWELE